MDFALVTLGDDQYVAGQDREARAGLTETLNRFKKFVRERWRLPAAEPLLNEVQTLLAQIDRGKCGGEGFLKRIPVEAESKGARRGSV